MPNSATGNRRSLGLPIMLMILGSLHVTACGPLGEGFDNRSVLLHPNGDVLSAGSDVQVTDSVLGDAMTAGGSVVFDGFAGGSYVGAGGSQEVDGHVEGSARVVGGSVTLSASVGRNVTLAGGRVEITSAAQIDRNAYLAGRTVEVEGTVDGDVYVGGREVVLNGAIGGDVRVEAEQLTVGPDARLSGDLRYRTADGAVTMDPSAQIAGSREALAPREEPGLAGAIVRRLIRLLAFLLTGTVLVALLPATIQRLGTKVATRPGAAIGAGLLGLCLVPIGALVAAVTILGLPLAAIMGALFAIALYVSPVVPAALMGGVLLGAGAESPSTDRAGEVKRFLLGGLILGVAMLLPWVGWLARLAAVALGFGAVALLLFGPERRA